MPRVIRIHEHGSADVLRYETVDLPPPGLGEVMIDVRAIGLNRSEVMFRNGRHIESAQFPARLGYEAAGTIAAIGPNVTGLQIGDAVSIVPPPSVTRWGTYGEIATIPAKYVVRHPANLSFVEAAGVWMANITAYGALIDIAGLAAADTALILAASSSVGLACCTIAKSVGATVIATTRTAAKRQALLDAGIEHVVVTDDEDLAGRVLQITNGRGARVVMDPIGGSGLDRKLVSMAQYGTLIAYGALAPELAPLNALLLIGKGLSIRGYTFKEIVLDDVRRERAVRYIVDALAKGKLLPTIAKVFDFDEMAAAHRYLEANAQIGKIVVVIDQQRSSASRASCP